MRWLVIVVGLILATGPARADVLSGKELKGFCDETSASSFDMGACLGYITGIADAMHRSTVDIYGWRACMENGVTVEELRTNVVAFLNAHPEFLELGADSLVARALADSYPCD